MKYIFPLIIILLLVSTSFVGVSNSLNDVEQSSISPLCDGKTLYVGGSGPNNYTKIQDAINDSSDGDTVFVYADSSPYYEYIIINKSIILSGEDKNNTILDGGEMGNVINISADNVTISGFKIQNSGHDYFEDAGIFGKYCNYSNFFDNIFNNDVFGILLIYSNNNNIENNIFKENGMGFKCDCSYNNSIKNNSFSDHIEGVLIYLSNNNFIMDNIFIENNWISIWIESSHNNLIKRNNIISPQPGTPEAYSDIRIDRSNNNTITNNSLTNLGETYNNGIRLTGCSKNIIASNVIKQYESPGIMVKGSLHNTISGNIFQNNNIGVLLSKAMHNKIYCNNFLDNKRDANYIRFSIQNEWDGNYWGRARLFPKPIIGAIGTYIPSWINFDWHPAKKPYDI